MSFATRQQANARHITGGPAGEAIGYRSHPNFTFAQINAKIRRNPIDVTTGDVMEQTIELFVSKADVPAIVLGKDQVELLADAEEGKAPPLYRVVRKLDDFPGAFTLLATRGKP